MRQCAKAGERENGVGSRVLVCERREEEGEGEREEEAEQEEEQKEGEEATEHDDEEEEEDGKAEYAVLCIVLTCSLWLLC